MKNILQTDNHKRDKKIQHRHILHSSIKQNSEKGWEGVDTGGKIEYVYLKLKKENNEHEYDPSGNSNLPFHVETDILNLLLLYEFFMFFHVQ